MHVPYKGTASALTALIGGQVQVMFTDAGGVAPHVKAGKLRALAATSAEPSLLFPGLPTVAASGVPGYELVGITGIYAPAQDARYDRQPAEPGVGASPWSGRRQRAVLGLPAVRPSATLPSSSQAVIRADIARKSKVIKDAGIKAE